MKTRNITNTRITNRKIGMCLSSIAILLALGLSAAHAETPLIHQHPTTTAPTDAAALQVQLNQLSSQVAELARIIQSHGGTGTQMPNGSVGMSGRGAAGKMKMMEMDNMMMGGMKGGAMPGMNDEAEGMGMMGMEMMGTGGMQNMTSALPGFPGASHLYHIGATGFFLDHPQHITLTIQQQTTLNKIKEQAALAKNKSDRELEQAEQELWELTAADQPDTGKIESKVKGIEKLRSNQRLAFIHAVGYAAKVLTDEQRRQLVGLAATAKAGTSNAPHTSHAP